MVLSMYCPFPVRSAAVRPSIRAVPTPKAEMGSGELSPIGRFPCPDWYTEFPERAPIVGLKAGRWALGPVEP